MLKLRARDNKHQAVWLVEPGVKVGRSASNDLILDHSAIAGLQFVIGVRADRLIMHNRAPQTPITLNGRTAPERCLVKERDVIGVGGIELEVIDPKKDPEAPPPPSDWSLKANSAALASRVFPLKGTTVVGRSSECDIHLAVAHLSRRHAQLQVIEGLLYVKDLGSANGTFLNGKPVSEARVRRGDELRFDTLAFGVLGPSDELDKTSVRVAAAPVAQKPGRSAEPPLRPRPSPVARHRARVSPPAPEPVSVSGSTRRRWVGWLILALLAALAAVVVLGR
ncbi:FHA domain-containing protein [Marinimicrobium sp. C2-29]|uniref:FHA domain-containing protein n=1 Tax=Marinimicrobium sp. C2-29 TaxID=3139825 RepID=UPI003139F48E